MRAVRTPSPLTTRNNVLAAARFTPLALRGARRVPATPPPCTSPVDPRYARYDSGNPTACFADTSPSLHLPSPDVPLQRSFFYASHRFRCTHGEAGCASARRPLRSLRSGCNRTHQPPVRRVRFVRLSSETAGHHSCGYDRDPASRPIYPPEVTLAPTSGLRSLLFPAGHRLAPVLESQVFVRGGWGSIRFAIPIL